MAKFSKEQWIGILLLLAAVMMFIPIAFVDEKIISAIIVVAIGLYKLIF